MSFLFSEKRETARLVLHIDSSSVSGALVLYAFGKKPKIQRNFRVEQDVFQKDKTGELYTGVEKSLESVLTSLYKEKPVFDAVTVIFGDSWCQSQTKKIHIEQDRKFIITKNFLADILTKETGTIQKEFESVLSQEPLSLTGEVQSPEKNSVVIIAKNILHTEVNGYYMAECVGVQTKVFDLSINVSGVSTKIYNLVLDTVFSHTHMHPRDIECNSASFVTYSILNTLPVSGAKDVVLRDFLALCVSGERTDVILSENSTLGKNTHIPIGVNTFLRRLSKMLDVSSQIAESTLRIVLNHKMDQEITGIVEKSIDDIEKEWAVYFQDALVSMDSRVSVPTQVFLFVPEYLSEIFSHFISLPKEDITSNFRRKVRIILVNKDFLSEFFEPSVFDSFDPQISLCTLFYKK